MHASSPCEKKHTRAYPFALWIPTGIFIFIMRSIFILLNSSYLSHIANDLLKWKQFHFPCQNISSQLRNLIPPCVSWNDLNFFFKSKVSNTRVVPSPVNRTLRFFSCFLLANNMLKSIAVSCVFELTYLLLPLLKPTVFSLNCVE